MRCAPKYCSFLNTLIYASSGPHGFREDYHFLKVFPIINLWELLITWASQFGPEGLVWQELCRGPLDFTTQKIYKLWSLWFQRFSKVFPILVYGNFDYYFNFQLKENSHLISDLKLI